uniref:Set domain protein n=1 Tax=Solanum tuberosum TaxID=4113 RepID=M1D932_SOLTU
MSYRHKKLKEEDVAVCECKYGVNDPETACVERCLNVLTSIECTLGYYQSGENCRNQPFVAPSFIQGPKYTTIYIVDNLPLCDSTDDDESSPVISRTSGGNEHANILNDGEGSTFKVEPTNSATKKKSQHKPKLKLVDEAEEDEDEQYNDNGGIQDSDDLTEVKLLNNEK